MSAEVKRRLAGIFDRHAEPYRTQVETMMERGQARSRQLLLDWLAAEPGERVLDLGCGPGAFTLPLAHAVGPSGQVIAVDLAPGMLDLLRQRAPRNVRTLLMDIEELDFEDGEFDAAIAGFSFQFCLDLDRALGEAHRVLRPGGRLAAIFPAFAAAAWGRLGLPAFDGIRELLPAGPPDQAATLTTRARLSHEGEVHMALTAAGFRTTAVRRLEEPLRHDNPHQLLKVMGGWWEWVGRLEQLGPADSLRIADIVLEQLRSRFGDGPVEIPSPVLAIFARS